MSESRFDAIIGGGGQAGPPLAGRLTGAGMKVALSPPEVAGSHVLLAVGRPGGDEAIHGIIDMMNAEAPWSVLQKAVPIHPTVSELIPTLLADLAPAQ